MCYGKLEPCAAHVPSALSSAAFSHCTDAQAIDSPHVLPRTSHRQKESFAAPLARLGARLASLLLQDVCCALLQGGGEDGVGLCKRPELAERGQRGERGHPTVARHTTRIARVLRPPQRHPEHQANAASNKVQGL